MGLNNFIVQKAMKHEAKRIATLVAESYPVIKAQNPNFSDLDVSIAMLCGGKHEFSKLSEASRKKVTECCQSIQGACYFAGIELGKIKGFMVFRCLQFTQYMDRELEMKGFKSQSLESKKQALKALDLLVNGWERWI